MSKKEEKDNVKKEPTDGSQTIREAFAVSEVISASKTAGLFTPDENLKWVAFYRQLKAVADETRDILKDMYAQYEVVWIDQQHVDVRKTGEENWKNYQEAEAKLMDGLSGVVVEKFLTEDKVVALKDKNDYTTQVMEYLITLLVNKDGNKNN